MRGINPAERVAAGFAAVGVAIVIAGAALSTVAPELRDGIHQVGLLAMLLGAGTFLLARRFPGNSPSSIAAEAVVHEAATGAEPTGTRETAKNLAIVGAAFLLGAIAAGLAMARVLSNDHWLYWVLLGLGVMGAGALVVGAVGYALASIFDPPPSAREGDHRRSPPIVQ